MNRVRVQILMIFVLFLGLLACTPDKPKQREDQWRFSPPEIVMPSSDGLERGRLKVGEASQQEMTMSTELAFSAMTADVTLEIDSLCISDGKNYEESFSVRAPSSLSFGSIVPARALLVPTDQPIECSFDFSAINEHRSRHHFLIPGVKLVGGNNYGSLIVSKKLQRISPSENPEEKVIVGVDELDQLAVDSEVQSGVAELVCADFTSRERFKSVDTINWKQLAYKQPIEVLEKVLAKFRQPCRLALKDESGLRTEISATVTLRYPPPTLKLTTSVIPYDQPRMSFTTQMPILNLNIKNESNIDQYFGLAMPTVDIKQVWTSVGILGKNNGDAYYFDRSMDPTAHITYLISGTDTSAIANGKMNFIIKAKSEVGITVIANGVFRDLSSSGSNHAGYLFLFSKPLRLERLESEFEVADEIALFSTLPHNFIETQVYTPTTSVKADWAYISRTLTEKARPTGGD